MLEPVGGQAPASLAAGSRPWLVLALLSALYTLSLIDRNILILLIGPIKTQFQLSDVQIGLLIGTAFASVYAVLGVPAGRFADQGNRKMLVVTGAIIWCLCTIASGFAGSFAALLVLRLGLAAGEAVLTPAAHSMIGDLFPREKRSLAASLYSTAGLIGPPLAFSGGALIISGIESVKASGVQIDMETWQVVLIAVGLPCLTLAILFWMIVREPLRATERGMAPAPVKGDVVRQILSRKKMYLGLFFTCSFAAGCTSGLLYWSMESLKRDFGWSAVEAGSAFGPIILVASVVGVMGAPWITARVRARGRMDAVIRVTAVFLAVACVSLAFGPMLSDPHLRLAVLGLGLTGSVGGGLNIVVSMQEVAPARMRGTFVALLYMGNTILGAGASPVLIPTVGGLSDAIGLSGGLAIVGASLTGTGVLLLCWIRSAFEREAIAGFPVVAART